jgi:hypothetical protein
MRFLKKGIFLLVALAMTAGLTARIEGIAADKGKSIPKTKDEFQKMYVDFLLAEGYKPEIDKDGDVIFKYEGKNYFIQVNETDGQYFRLVFPSFWPIESEDERKKVLLAANNSTWMTKGAKICMVRNDVWISVDVFMATPDQFRDVFKRSLTAIQSGLANFMAEMKK